MVQFALKERISAYLRDRLPSFSRDMDIYLSENMPKLIEANSLASLNELMDIDMRFKNTEFRVKDLELWKEKTTLRLEGIKTRIETLEHKYGVR